MSASNRHRLVSDDVVPQLVLTDLRLAKNIRDGPVLVEWKVEVRDDLETHRHDGQPITRCLAP